MSNKTIKFIIIAVSVLVLAISLTQNAVVIDHNGIKPQSSLAYFFMGSMAVLGGGVFEWFIWLANVLCLMAIISLMKDNRNALIRGAIALVLAISFRFWKEELGSESGAMAKIISFEAGYYLWVLSIFVLNVGIVYYFFEHNKTSPASKQ